MTFEMNSKRSLPAENRGGRRVVPDGHRRSLLLRRILRQSSARRAGRGAVCRTRVTRCPLRFQEGIAVRNMTRGKEMWHEGGDKTVSTASALFVTGPS